MSHGLRAGERTHHTATHTATHTYDRTPYHHTHTDTHIAKEAGPEILTSGQSLRVYGMPFLPLQNSLSLSPGNSVTLPHSLSFKKKSVTLIPPNSLSLSLFKTLSFYFSLSALQISLSLSLSLSSISLCTRFSCQRSSLMHDVYLT